MPCSWGSRRTVLRLGWDESSRQQVINESVAVQSLEGVECVPSLVATGALPDGTFFNAVEYVEVRFFLGWVSVHGTSCH